MKNQENKYVINKTKEEKKVSKTEREVRGRKKERKYEDIVFCPFDKTITSGEGLWMMLVVWCLSMTRVVQMKERMIENPLVSID
jgi:hypothetical protein